MIRLPLLLALAPLAAPADPPSRSEYTGRFREHPALPEIAALVAEATQDLELPDWLLERAPRVQVELVDLKEPREHHVWPGDVVGSVQIEPDGKDTVLTLELPIDSFLGDPRLAVAGVRRAIFGGASMARAMGDGQPFTKIYSWGGSNPLIEAMAAQWAGTLDQEIEFVLRRHLLSDEKLASLVRPIEPSAAGDLELPVEGPDDLTWHVLVRMLTPKEKDAKLEKLYEALARGQDLEGALKKASGKKLDKLNDELAEFFEDYVEERFPKKRRADLRDGWSAMQSGDQDELTRVLGGWKDSTFLDPHHVFLLAAFQKDADAWTLFLDDADHYAECDLGPMAIRKCGTLLLARDGTEERRRVYERMRDEYGWVKGLREEAEKELD